MKKIILLISLGVVVLAAGVGAAYLKNYYSMSSEERRLVAWMKTLEEDSKPVPVEEVSEYIRNLNIKAGDAVSSPLVIRGEAKAGIGGGIQLVDGNKKYIVGDAIITKVDRANALSADWANPSDRSFSEFSSVLYWDESQVVGETGEFVLRGSNPGRPSFDILTVPIRFSEHKAPPLVQFSETATLSLGGQVALPDGLILTVTDIFSVSGSLRATLLAQGGKIDKASETQSGTVVKTVQLYLIDRPVINDNGEFFSAGWVTKTFSDGTVEIYKYGEESPRYTVAFVSISATEVSFSVKP